MKERPILFSGAMVRALLDGSKTQTRRIVKPQPGNVINQLYIWKDSALTVDKLLQYCPYGLPGDRLYVRENCWIAAGATDRGGVAYCADLPTAYIGGIKKRPSIHMPRWASRILLEITGVRVERLNDCCDADCVAEGIGLNPSAVGVPLTNPVGETLPRAAYRGLWESINGAGSWAANPFVWVVEFKQVMP